MSYGGLFMRVLLLPKAQKQYRRFDKPIKGRIATALRPLFRLIKASEPIIIETDLTDEEKRIIAKGMEEYKAHPESAVPLDSLL
jgi:hypothetical protein